MKKILICMSLLTFVVAFASFYNGYRKTNFEYVPVVAQSVTNKVIVIDAGHGIPDKGAINSDGFSEEKANLDIALKLQKLLEANFATVLLTRSDENGIYELDAKTIAEKKVSDIKNRVKIANSSSADLFVSIHLNKIDEEKYHGWQTFFKEGDDYSKKAATFIQNNLNDTISSENKRVPLKINSIYLMKHVEIPITLVECGFLSNKNEAKQLQTDEYQSKLAWGIYNGILDYFKEIGWLLK